MRWQRIAQIAIAVFVIGFIVVLVVSLRRSAAIPQHTQTKTAEAPPKAVIFNPNPGDFAKYDGNRKVLDVKFGAHTAYADGRVALSKGVKIVSNRNGKDLVINAQEADLKLKGNQELEHATLKRDVWLTTAGGVDVKADEATYAESDGIVKIPGAVTFRKGRMSGSGIGATYDRDREVLWILEKARIAVAADKSGAGAIEGEADTAGMARAEHYMRLTRNARLRGEGRTMSADEITIILTEDDERVQTTQLRGNSRIVGGGGGPQSMDAQDIDLMYADDGRTLKNANLMQRAVVQMTHSPGSGQAGAGHKRIAGNLINIALAPDGSTVTNLSATENVQVDLPAEPKIPAKRIRAATLVAIGAPDAGLRTATFTGNVEYRETQAAARNVPAVDRTARSDSLVIDTKPGLGAIEKADFRGNVTFNDAPDVSGEGPHALYYLERGRIELLSASGYPGKPPRINDGKISVNAATLGFSLTTRELQADTKVKSTILAKQTRGRGQPQSKTPSMMKQDEPINITSNRLHYLGSAAKATYSGTVSMWQDVDDAASIKGDTLVVDDKTGNLEVKGNAITNFMLEETDEKSGQKKKTRTTGKADLFEYDDAGRLATYTGNAQFNGPQGNLTAARIQVTLKANVNEVDRLEAWAKGGVVTVKETVRIVTGTHLTYTAANDTYVMVGSPVVFTEEDKNGCSEGRGLSLTFIRGSEAGNWKLDGKGATPGSTKYVACPGAKR